MNFKKLLIFFLLGLVATACSLENSQKDTVDVRFEVLRENQSSLKNLYDFITPFFSPSDYRCLGVNVTGAGIGNSDGDSGHNWESIEYKERTITGESACTYPGVTSRLVNNQSGAQLGLTVPSGSRRLIQVFGFEDEQGYIQCSNPSSIFDAFDELFNYYGTSAPFRIIELGRVFKDLFNDSTVGIPVTTNAANFHKRNLGECIEGFEEELELYSYRYSDSSANFDLDFTVGGDKNELCPFEWDDNSISKCYLYGLGSPSYLAPGAGSQLFALATTSKARSDLLFNIDSVSSYIDSFEKINIDINAECLAEDTVYFDIWNSYTGQWASVVALSFTATTNSENYFFSFTKQELGLSSFDELFTNIDLDATNEGNYIYLSIRTSSTCGTFTLSDVSVSFE